MLFTNFVDLSLFTFALTMQKREKQYSRKHLIISKLDLIVAFNKIS